MTCHQNPGPGDYSATGLHGYVDPTSILFFNVKIFLHKCRTEILKCIALCASVRYSVRL
jgi:hypothetical protein